MGLIRHCRTILREPSEPRIWSVSAIPAGTSLYMGTQVAGDAGAVGFSYEQAAVGAIGECIERYCCGNQDPDTLVYASQAELGDEAVGMDVFAVHAPEQYRPGFPFPPWRPDTRITWAKGRSLHDGRRRYVPACLVYVPFVPRGPGDLLTLSVSSGNACHTDRDAAVLSGLYECLERDAFMIMWLRRLRPTRLDILADPVLADLYRQHFDGCDLQFHLFDMTTDLRIPSVVCFVEGTSDRGPLVGMGASTRLSERDAVVKALLEAAQDMVWCRDLLRRKPEWRPAPDWSNVRDFEDHVRLYCEPDMKPHLSFILDTPRVRPTAPPDPRGTREALDVCLAELRAHGLECIVIDTTAPDVAAAGFHAPKVMIPGLVPLTAVHRLPALGSPRLRSVPIRLGAAGPHDPVEFNPIPHPFP
jgi:ribosomal protein S12 methylthiotransferase accessory factor